MVFSEQTTRPPKLDGTWPGAAALRFGSDKSGRVREALIEAGIDLAGTHAGRLVDAQFVADVRLEPDDVIRVRSEVDGIAEPRKLLRQCAGAAGSVRWALGECGLQLAAETRVNGVDHLPHSMSEIRAEFSRVLHQSETQTAERDEEPEPQPDEKPVAEMIRAALQEAGWSKEDVSETTAGVELQVPIEGKPVAISVMAQAGAAIVRRTLLPKLPEGMQGCVVAHHALLRNAWLRCCRLAIDGASLCIESRLHAQRIDADWLSFTLRAVASAAHSTTPELELLATDRQVAEVYADMFGVNADD